MENSVWDLTLQRIDTQPFFFSEAPTCQMWLNPEAGPFHCAPLQQLVLLRCRLPAASPRFRPLSVWPFPVRLAKGLPLRWRKTLVQTGRMLKRGGRSVLRSRESGVRLWRLAVASSRRFGTVRWRFTGAALWFCVARWSRFCLHRPHHVDLHKNRKI